MSAKLLPEAKTDHTLKKLLIVVSIRLIPVISLQLLFWSGEISPLAEKSLRIGNYHTILLHPLQTSFSAKNAMTETRRNHSALCHFFQTEPKRAAMFCPIPEKESNSSVRGFRDEFCGTNGEGNGKRIDKDKTYQ